VFYIAKEICSSEEVFVDVLTLLNVVSQFVNGLTPMKVVNLFEKTVPTPYENLSV
jgi:hypothetical protein